MKKFITLLTIAMVAILATSCGTSKNATQTYAETGYGRSNTDEFTAEMQGRGNVSALIAVSNNQDVHVSNQSKTVQRSNGNSVREDKTQTIEYVITSDAHIEGVEYESKDMSKRDRNGKTFGRVVTAKVNDNNVYDSNYFNSDNH